jgi:hypothetical protein
MHNRLNIVTVPRMQNKRPRHQQSAQPIRNEIMNRPQNPELHPKQALSLHRAYILVGVVGAVMLVFTPCVFYLKTKSYTTIGFVVGIFILCYVVTLD